MRDVEFGVVGSRSNGPFAWEGKNNRDLQQDDFTYDYNVPKTHLRTTLIFLLAQSVIF